MEIKAEVIINAPVENIWKAIADIENSADFISGIEKVEILENPGNGLVGTKWEETRTMFGQTATEIMWITDAEVNKYYKTRAERPGVVYISGLNLEDLGGSSKVTMQFDAEISSFGMKIMSAITGIFFKKATRDAIQQDLEDIKKYVEGN